MNPVDPRWRRGLLLVALVAGSSSCFLLNRNPCLEEVHPEWHACYQKSGCDTAFATPDGGPTSKQDGGTEITCGCCDE